MNEWLKKFFGGLKDKWSKWKPIQKVILIVIILAVIAAIIITASVSRKDSSVKLFSAQVSDQQTLTRILDRIDIEHVEVTEKDGFIYVKDEATKRRLHSILNDENLIPSDIDIWSDYFDRSWSTTDADQNVKLGIKKQQELERFLKNYDDIQDATVTLELPPTKLLAETQDPVTCSVIIRTKNGSSLTTDRNRIKGIERAVLGAVEGLKKEYLIITDVDGNQINNDLDMKEFDRLSAIEKGERMKVQRETGIRAKILKAFQSTYGRDRVRDILVSVDMDLSEVEENSVDYHGITIKEDNPDTPFDDSEIVLKTEISSQTVNKKWQGELFNPEGPSGVEGQNPPVYSDLSNQVGSSEETGVTANYVIPTVNTHKIKAPKVDKVTVSVNIDGKWRLVPDGKGGYELDEFGWRRRTYIPLTPQEITDAENIIKGAVGYDRDAGYQVYVTNTAYDRDEEHQQEDKAYFAKQQRYKTFILVLVAIVVVLIGFIVFRVISKAIEKKRREREARLLAEQQAAREKQLWDARDEGVAVTMSVEETRRMELQENAITMAKEHPEDVAMLIRTWLMEE